MITAILIGAGQRGIGAYGDYALKNPNDIQFIAVADPNEERRTYFSKLHQINPSRHYLTWEAILSQPKMADACFICTQDQMHFEPTKKALELGYHVFLEKPMATTPEEVYQLGQLAEKTKRVFGVGHVLRYTPFFQTIKHFIDDGMVGQLMTIQHNENVGYYHQAHSYVRGNWRKQSDASPMILAKSCHDMDILAWLVNSPIKQVASFGHLTHFTAKNAPKGAPKRCLDGCPVHDTCPYFAPKLYLEQYDWLKYTITPNVTKESVMKALQEGPYGRCVYYCDNDVVDHQVVNLDFANDVTVAFTMSAFTQQISRTIKIMGTKGELHGDMETNTVTFYDFQTLSKKTFHVDHLPYGHGGGDYGIMKAFVEAVRDQKPLSTHASGAVISHLIAFAAEESRVSGKTIRMDDYITNLQSASVKRPIKRS